ncbi:hypothetical protein N6L27_22595 [Leisingera sp. SS27]|uniref:hypothetical protein n=1 Tax=Leisingera sp. SS27 TaxID=2979462 RepID=UPI00232D26A5|nr:hypothetical protein [Leisingera sp. SS27]MDC0660805.1 hypothetical protein [Leisingera sp. SS27]
MTNFVGLSSDSGLSDVLKMFPRNSENLLRLLDDIMCADGELSRGDREAIAAFVSKQNTTPYCVFYHTLFSEVISGPIEDTNQRIQPLLNFAECLHSRNNADIAKAFDAVRKAGWSEGAIYEAVEVCGIFDFINTIVLASGLQGFMRQMGQCTRSQQLTA